MSGNGSLCLDTKSLNLFKSKGGEIICNPFGVGIKLNIFLPPVIGGHCNIMDTYFSPSSNF